MSIFYRLIHRISTPARTLGLGLIGIRTISGPGGLDKHFAPYPALPKVAPVEAPAPTPSSHGSATFIALTIQNIGNETTPAQRWSSVHEAAAREVREPGNVYTGRSIPVSDRMDISIAYRRLHMILSRNRVRSELFLQRRYEKPSDRERRLKSERHRRRFAAWIRKKVQLVSEIRRRG